MTETVIRDLFSDIGENQPSNLRLSDGAYVLRSFAKEFELPVFNLVKEIAEHAHFRHMLTPGGHTMSAAMTNCGALGWISDLQGYRYARHDPLTKKPWPAIPKKLMDLAGKAAIEVGYKNFRPNSCLINRYVPGSRMSLHQDKNEKDFEEPIVSLSLGLPVKFMFGGSKRNDPVKPINLESGDMVVWGAESRLHYHGVAPLKPGFHKIMGECRICLTFRSAD